MKCPGQDTQYWDTEAIYEVDCPQCGKPVEFYKDDTNRKCSSCGHRFVNPKMDFGCAAYCQYAEQCLGTLPEEFIGAQDNLLKDKVAVEMKRVFKSDFHRIGHSTRVARYAEAIAKVEGGNLPVILCAAYLHDVDDAPPGTNGSTFPVALEILNKLKAKEQVSKAVIALLQDHAGEKNAGSTDLMVFEDALHIAHAEEQMKKAAGSREELETFIEQSLLSSAGRTVARDNLVKYIQS